MCPPHRGCQRCPPPRLEEHKNARCSPSRRRCQHSLRICYSLPIRLSSSPLPPTSLCGSYSWTPPLHRHCPRCPLPHRKERRTSPRCLSRPPSPAPHSPVRPGSSPL